MDSSAKLKQFLLFLMAFEATFRAILGILIFKGENKSFSFCLSMFSAWTVARFTTLLVWRSLGIKDIFPMGVVFLKAFIKVCVTFLTGLRSNIALFLNLLLTEGHNSNEGYHNNKGDHEYRHVFIPIHQCLLRQRFVRYASQ